MRNQEEVVPESIILGPAAEKGYRSAISATLKQISKVYFSNDAIKRFECPTTRPQAPKWDLELVLLSLCSAPYDHLESCGQKELNLNFSGFSCWSQAQ